ncbi:MAG: HD domain-containing protein [Treponema sp.]|nr:HD domain-containing protein [Treponema sp.]
MKIKINPLLKEFASHFEKAGFKVYLVGGAVRDIFLHKKPNDFDAATNATPQDVMKLFKTVIPTGFEHGTVTVHFKGEEIEVTTFRTESGYSDGRHPDSINYAATIEEDLARRDFTINAIAADLKDGTIVDPYNGRRDIKKKIIRTVGNAHERFMEDGLRPVRCLRFACKLGFSIEKYTYSEIFNKEILDKVASISIERFRDEFEKMLASDKPSVALQLMEETGITNIFIPELLKGRLCIQSDYRGFHDFDVLNHLYYACDGAPSSKLNVRLAALFHDIGKPDAKKTINDTITFYNHERIGAELTQQILTRLKFPNAVVDNVCHLIREHMFNYEPNWTVAAVRRFIIRVGKENLDDLYDLRVADIYGMHNQKVDFRFSEPIARLIELKNRIATELEKNNALSLKDLAINGNDLIAAGFEKGKKLGLILNHLLDCVIEDPEMNTKEKLLEVAASLRA